MGKQAIDGAKRSDSFHVDPFTVKLAGIDFECGAEDPLYNNVPRNRAKIDSGDVDSVLRIGVVTPIAVIKRGDDVCVVDGNQRVRWARAATERLRETDRKAIVMVPCQTPRRGDSPEQLSEIVIATNEHRVETGPVAKAEIAALHLRRLGGNVKEAAKAFGISPAALNSLLTINEAAPEVKRAITSGKLSATAAVELAALPRDKQAENLERVLAGGGTVEKAKTERKKAEGKAASGRPTTSIIREAIAKLCGQSEELSDYEEGTIDALSWVLGEANAEVTATMQSLLDSEAEAPQRPDTGPRAESAEVAR